MSNLEHMSFMDQYGNDIEFTIAFKFKYDGSLYYCFSEDGENVNFDSIIRVEDSVFEYVNDEAVIHYAEDYYSFLTSRNYLPSFAM